MNKWNGCIFLLITFLLAVNLGGTPCYSADDGIVVRDLSLEERKSARKELLKELIIKYENDQTFAKIYEYMTNRFKDLQKTHPPRYPDLIIEETLEKSRMMIERTKPFVGRNFTRVYNPEQVERNVQRYLWLKGICFLILGINDEHKMALTYFYLPEHAELKRVFLKDVVSYSFPEVSNIPENKAWQTEMIAVMERLGYKIFNIERFIE